MPHLGTSLHTMHGIKKKKIRLPFMLTRDTDTSSMGQCLKYWALVEFNCSSNLVKAPLPYPIYFFPQGIN